MVYVARECGKCHGLTGAEGPGPRLVGPGRLGGVARHPFAPSIWSYINQMMPFDLQVQHVHLGPMPPRIPSSNPLASCCLTPNEVYSLTAYLLFGNGIIKETDVMDAKSLPQIRMPGLDHYVPPPFTEWKPGMRQAQIK